MFSDLRTFDKASLPDHWGLVKRGRILQKTKSIKSCMELLVKTI